MYRLTGYVSAILFILMSLPMWAQNYRSINGVGNNAINVLKGSTNDYLINYVPQDFADKISIPKLDETYNKPNPRKISNALFDQPLGINDKTGLSDFTWVFAQFIDHDINLQEYDETQTLTNIIVPEDDQFFPPNTIIKTQRCKIAEGTGTSELNPARYKNKVTAFIDLSTIYGSDSIRATWLRTFQNGKLKVSQGNMLPWNTSDGEFNSPVDDFAPKMVDETNSLLKYFVAGDKRANENPLLIGLHTLFVREHNRICETLLAENPLWDDEKTYQEARKLNVAFLQSIVYNEWLPQLGIKIPTFSGYQAQIDPQVMNVFSAAAFRIGYTLINSNVLRLDSHGKSLPIGNLQVKDAYYNPVATLLTGGIEPFFRGMATQVQQEMDGRVIDDIRNFKLSGKDEVRLDLIAINITRGRERGLPAYNGVSNAFGFPSYRDFISLTDNADEAAALEAIYGSVANLDPWVGMLAEKHMPNAIMGRLMMAIFEKQFQDLRDGDRFYFENDTAMTAEEIKLAKSTTLRDILMRNTSIDLMQENVFRATSYDDIPFGPKPLPIDLRAELYPNPVSQMANFNIYSEQKQNANMLVYDVNGRVVYQNILPLEDGITKSSIDFSTLTGGVYNVVISNARNYTIVRMFKD